MGMGRDMGKAEVQLRDNEASLEKGRRPKIGQEVEKREEGVGGRKREKEGSREERAMVTFGR